MKQPKVLMLGTDVTTKGGIASVICDYIDSGLMTRLNVRYIATHKDGSRITKALFFLVQFPKALLACLTVNIVHIHTSHGWSFRRLVTLLFAAHLLRRDTALHVHGSQFDTYYDGASAMERALIRAGLRKADIVLALSSDWQSKLTRIEPRATIRVLRNGVDCSKYTLAAQREIHSPISILFLGRLGERKGIYDLLQAIELLDPSNFRFVLAGDGDISKVRAIVADRGWSTHVEVPGWAGPEEKRTLLHRADLYVLPSYHEGLPISILEAMAAGLPVVSTPVGGIAEAVHEGINGCLVNPGDPVALADAIRKCCSDSGVWEAQSKQSLKLATEEFGMNTVERNLKQIYGALQQHLPA